jgi:virulence-associated protein VagC
MVTQAKVFKSGNSQAIRLPRAFRLKSAVVTLEKTPQGLLVRDDGEATRRAKLFARLEGSCPDFPQIAANANANLRRNWE